MNKSHPFSSLFFGRTTTQSEGRSWVMSGKYGYDTDHQWRGVYGGEAKTALGSGGCMVVIEDGELVIMAWRGRKWCYWGDFGGLGQ